MKKQIAVLMIALLAAPVFDIRPLMQYSVAASSDNGDLPLAHSVLSPRLSADGKTVTIGNYIQIAKTQIAGTIYEYVYTAVLTNSGAALKSATARVTSSDPYTVVIDGELSFGNVSAVSARRSGDTFSIRHDSQYPFNPASLKWDISSSTDSNPPPTAHAGEDQTIALGGTIQLDGSKSTGAGEAAITYRWTIVGMPEGSTAVLSDASVVRPTFVADLPGDYVIQLICSDAAGESTPTLVKVSVGAVKPTSNAGEDQRAQAGDLVKLDGSKSVDRNGLPLTYSWTILETPEGSAATLDDPRSVTPSFTVDRPGSYKLQLIVSDDKATGDPDLVEISTAALPPTADAGEAQSVALGATVTLDGSKSKSLNGLPLTYSWSFVSRPEGSLAELEDSATATPQFTVDQPGDYVVKLVVGDSASPASEPATVLISTHEVAPVANAGEGQTVTAYTEVTLDGSESHDPQGYPLTYAWTVLTQPEGSDVQLSDAAAEQPTFTPEILGTYVFQLVVNNGKQDGEPATVKIEVAALTAEVPDLTGKTMAEAESELAKHHLVKGAVTSSHHATIAEGKIISQTPTAGTSAVAGASVALEVSLGPSVAVMVETPDILGLTSAEAQAALAAAGLTDGAITETLHDTVPAGRVVSQNPAAGALVAPETAVSFVISLGKAKKPVPDVVNMTDEDAREAIIAAGFTVGDVTEETNAEVPKGSVIRQLPSAGTDAEEGSAVDMAISTGLPPAVVVADFGGMNKQDALEALEDAGLKVGEITYEYSDSVEAGNVISQTPGKGSEIIAGEKVSMVVSLGRETELPPDPALVAPPSDPVAATSTAESTEFLYTGDNPIQKAVEPDAIEPERAAVVKGRVLDKDGAGLPGATVTILNHPELGYTLSRADGGYDLAVNGESLLTLNFAKDGYLTVQRQAETQALGFTDVSDVRMLQMDPVVTAIIPNAPEMQVVRGSVVEDKDGRRQATLLIPAGNNFKMVMPDGSRWDMDVAHIHITEFTVGEGGPDAMPAPLPPQTMYTYALKYSVEEVDAAGAETVEFDPEIIGYEYNFLNFPIGTPVPVGYYDVKLGTWRTGASGVVVKIVSITGGLAQVDTNGDGVADNAGITPDEQKVLAELYSTGQSLWRTTTKHFEDSLPDMNPSGCTGLDCDCKPLIQLIHCPDGTTKEWNTCGEQPQCDCNIQFVFCPDHRIGSNVDGNEWKYKKIPWCPETDDKPECPDCNLQYETCSDGTPIYWCEGAKKPECPEPCPDLKEKYLGCGNDVNLVQWCPAWGQPEPTCDCTSKTFQCPDGTPKGYCEEDNPNGPPLEDCPDCLKMPGIECKDDFGRVYYTTPEYCAQSGSEACPEPPPSYCYPVECWDGITRNKCIDEPGDPCPVEPGIDCRNNPNDPKCNKKSDCAEKADSVIGCSDQTISETLGVSGTPFTLNYNSIRMPGRLAESSVGIGASSAYIHPNIERIEVVAHVDGKSTTWVLPPQPNQKVTFNWDGSDYYGRKMSGNRKLTVDLKYFYPQQYYSTAYFGGPGGESLGVTVRGPAVAVTKTFNGTVRVPELSLGSRIQGLGGWTLDAHHAYDPEAKILYKGDGSQVAISSVLGSQSGGKTEALFDYNGMTGGVRSVRVPNIAGSAAAAAEIALRSAGFNVIQQWVIDPVVPEGTVISQNPSAGNYLDRGQTITLTISDGPGVEIPDVVGLTEVVAQATLAATGFDSTVKRKSDSTIPEGTVSGQYPVAGSPLAEGSSITLTVSSGLAIPVPDVVGKTEAEAQAVLEAVGLSANIGWESDPDVPKGSIISQNPVAGASVDKGSAVSLASSTGASVGAESEYIEIPDVVGMTEAAASAALRAKKLYPGSYKVYAPSVSKGLVVEQDPAAGNFINTAGQDGGAHPDVSIGVSSGPVTAVPDVAGMIEAEAQAVLQAAGFAVGVVYGSHPIILEGTVIGTNPPAKSNESIGSRIVVTVSSGLAIAVPDVTDMNLIDAATLLKTAGLSVLVQYRSDPDVAAGTVVGQEPLAGEYLDKGESVVLTVVAGTEIRVPVPNIAGMSPTQAQAELESAGFSVRIQYASHDTIPAGDVIGQNPPAGEMLVEGAEITLTISTGRGATDIPDFEMVDVAGGTFTMGCTPEQGDDCGENEKPAHLVTLSDFRIGKHEVTQGQWNTVMGENPSYFTGDDDRPVEMVSWNDIQGFIAKLNEREATSGSSLLWRLPTEAEWEYAARGGTKETSCSETDGCKYSGSNDIDEVAWYDGNKEGTTHPVGDKLANELEIHDMSGNVREWVNDWYGEDYYSVSPQTNPAGPTTGNARVVRAGSINDGALDGRNRVTYRSAYSPNDRYPTVGFRLAASVEDSVPVPDVVGQVEGDALVAIGIVGLRAVVEYRLYSDIAAGTVTEQNPPAGESLSKGAKVAITVSLGEGATVPEVEGLTETDAKALIAAVELKTVIQYRFSESIPAGEVIEQDPSAGSYLAKGASVTLLVSSGLRTIVPDVSGMTEEDARQALADAGLVAGTVNTVAHETIPAGQVAYTMPGAGQQLAGGSSVALYISATERTRPVVPDVAGLTEDDARQALADAGLSAGTATLVAHETVPAGVVVYTIPGAGQQVDDGSSVALYVSAEVRTRLVVPDVVGFAEEEAREALTNVGLTWTTSSVTHATIPADAVVYTTPGAGQQVDAGTRVTLYISTGNEGGGVPVPDVSGLRYEDIHSILTAAGLGSIWQRNDVSHATMPAGTVIYTSPAAGALVASGTRLAAYVSVGSDVYVPDVTGLRYEDIHSILAAAGLGSIWQRNDVSHATVPAGTVIYTSPAAGALVASGTRLAAYVSIGPDVYVPDVTGLRYEDIHSILTAAGLGSIWQRNDVSHATIPAGTVIYTSPAAGALVASGTRLAAYVSVGSDVYVPDVPGDGARLIVPDVTGLTETAAREVLIDAGLKWSPALTTHETVPAGKVAYTMPGAGQQVDSGSNVVLYISSGAGTRPVVPEVAGLTEVAASAAVTGAGLRWSPALTTHETVPAGFVVYTIPDAGQQVDIGSNVVLYISSGAGTRPVVPEVAGLTEVAAREVVTGAGLRWSPALTTHETVPAGIVVYTIPDAGQQVDSGSNVVLYISSGPGTRPVVPDVSGFDEADARQMLTDAGVIVETTASVAHATMPAGAVAYTIPGAGQQVDAGTRVTLYISAGNAGGGVPVPDVSGLRYDDIHSILAAAGLGSIWQRNDVSHATVPAGTVIYTSPAAGALVASGTRLAAYVSVGPDVYVPDVSGLRYDDIHSILTAAGLGGIWQRNNVSHATVPVGTVIYTSPAAGALVASGTQLAAYVSVGPDVYVPDVSGLRYDDIHSILAAAGLGGIWQRNGVSHATAPAGTVLYTNPVAGALVTSGTQLAAYVSVGPDVHVPDVSGLRYDDIHSILTAAGLGSIWQRNDVSHATVPAGTVIYTSPAAGALVANGTRLAAYVSKGPDGYVPGGDGTRSQVPDVTGLSETAARSALTGAGLIVYRTSVAHETIPAGAVAYTIPGVGQQVDGGSSVVLYISSGAGTRPVVPDVAGLSETAARSALTGAGLIVYRASVAHETIPAGEVAYTIPGAGQQVDSNSNVVLYISSGKGTRPVVPDVAGLTEGAASAEVTGAGLRWSPALTTHETVPAGIVVYTIPGAGQQADGGSNVVMYISSGKGTRPVVPEVAGLTEAEAREVVTGFGLRWSPALTTHETVPAGIVTHTIPGAGQQVASGSNVILYISSGDGTRPVVPDVSGFDEADAREALTDAGVFVETTTSIAHETIPAGAVAYTIPGAGQQVDAGTRVTLYISAGNEGGGVPVPDVSGQQYEDIQTILHASGLGSIWQRNDVSHATVPAGAVVYTSPAAGALVASGTQLAAYVSVGPDVYVPDVSGLRYDDIHSILAAAGLGGIWQRNNVSHATVPAGTVIYTSPAAGALVASGTQLAAYVSVGPDVYVPDVSGLRYDDIHSILAAAGLGGIWQRNNVSHATVPAGTVLYTNPAAGALVTSSTQLAAYVSVGPDVYVPDVSGLRYDDIHSILAAAGLGGIWQRNNVSHATVPAGTVLYTNPAAGALVASGTQLAAYVSVGPDVYVPDVSGLRYDDIHSILAAAGLGGIWQRNNVSHATVPAGTVIYTSPAAGALVAGGTQLAAYVSSGPDAVSETTFAAASAKIVPLSTAARAQVAAAVAETQVAEVVTAYAASPVVFAPLRASATGGNAPVTALATTLATTFDAPMVAYAAPMTAAEAFQPFTTTGMTVGMDGRVYVGVLGDGIWRSEKGQWRKIAGASGCSAPSFTDGADAREACIYRPTDIQVGIDGSIYYIEPVLGGSGDAYDPGARTDGVLMRIHPDNRITYVAGGQGTCNFSGSDCGDFGSTDFAQFGGGFGNLLAGREGNLYLADYGNARIRRIGTDGNIYSINDTELKGSHGSVAVEAAATAPDASLYVAYKTASGHVIRHINNSGGMSTVATISADCSEIDGSCVLAGSTADGTARLENINQLFVRKDGALLLATQGRVLQLANNYLYSVATLAASTETATVAAPWVATDVSGDYYYILREWYAGAFADSVRKYSIALPDAGASDTLMIPSEGQLHVFDKKGRHLRTVDALTQAAQYEFGYTGGGLLSTVTDGDGNVTRIERAAGGVPVAIVGPYGQRTALGIDNNGWLASVTDQGNRTYAMTYRAGGLLEKFIHPSGYYGYMEYDDLGRLVKDGNSEGGSKAMVAITTGMTTIRKPTGQSRSIIESNSNGVSTRGNVAYDGTVTTIYSRDDDTNVVITGADGTQTSIIRQPDIRFGMLAPYTASVVTTLPSGRISTKTVKQTAEFLNPADPLSLLRMTYATTDNGKTTTTTYDVAARTYTTSSPAGRQSVVTIDGQGRTLSERVSGMEPQYYSYDSRGKLESITQGSGDNQWRAVFSYRPDGKVESITDTLGRTVQVDSDKMLIGLLGGRTKAFRRDDSGNLTGLTPPSKQEHTFSYTAEGLTSRYTPPKVLGGNDTATNYYYDSDKHLIGVMRPSGKYIGYRYSSTTGQLDSVATANGMYTFSYDMAGRVISRSFDGETLTYRYDGSLKLEEKWQGIVNGRVNQSFDDNFQVETQTVNGAFQINFGYDADGLLTRAGNIMLTRDAQNGLLTGTVLGQVSDRRNYNGFGKPVAYSVSVGGSPVFEVSYTRDKLGRITDKNETVDGVTSTEHYEYDEAERLVGVTRNGVETSHYKYDANGNREEDRYSGFVSSGTYDAQDRMLVHGSTNYSYTIDGDLAIKTDAAGTTKYVYDVMSNLRSVTLPDGRRIEYVIDGNNRRIGRKVNGVMDQGFLYDGTLRIVAELDGAGAVVSRFIYASGVNVPDYMIHGGVEYRIVSDHLGSPRLVINVTDGTIVQRMDYDEFGNVLNDTNPGFQPFGFAGGLEDLDTSLIRFGVRDYDSQSGRWTAKDPIGFNGGDTNLFAYANNDPVNVTDPSGLKVYCIATEIHGAFAIAWRLRDYYCSDTCTGKHRNCNSYGGGGGLSTDLSLSMNEVPMPKEGWTHDVTAEAGIDNGSGHGGIGGSIDASMTPDGTNTTTVCVTSPQGSSVCFGPDGASPGFSGSVRRPNPNKIPVSLGGFVTATYTTCGPWM